ncbi:MAG: GAF domain-containing protein [Bacteroidota bacterium]|jgi:GAF domain-containing protein|nr:GAF domain-containing protein [Bacteroidota bacterium]
MAEELIISISKDKNERYTVLLPQITSLLKDENDLIANLANICAVLKYGMGFFWVGFYFVKDNELVLGPFQGPVACTRISYGKGVCGAALASKQIIIVPDVEKFPGHIACSSESRSEIVLPVFKDEAVAMILDVDSNRLDDFDEIDKEYLQKVLNLIEKIL